MKDGVPIPGSTKAKLIAVGIRLFSEQGYDSVEVDVVAAEAGVTVGALYHHFQSKQNFFDVLREDMVKRLIDRMEAVAEMSPSQEAVKAALLAAYDGALRIKVGRLLIDRQPRVHEDAIAHYLGQLAVEAGEAAGEMLGVVLAAALRAALAQRLDEPEAGEQARAALMRLLDAGATH